MVFPIPVFYNFNQFPAFIVTMGTMNIARGAAIIGGTSLDGGNGSLIGTFLGACIMGVLTNGLILLGVNDFYRQMITGFVIILAVIFDSYRQKLTNIK